MTPDRVTQLLSMASRALSKTGDALLAETGMRMAHVPVVVLLRRHEAGLTQKALAEAVGVEQPSMAELLTRMERDELVRREPHPTDARSRLIVLEGGQELRVQKAQERLADLEATAVAGLSSKEVTVLMRLLGRVVSNLQAGNEGAP